MEEKIDEEYTELKKEIRWVLSAVDLPVAEQILLKMAKEYHWRAKLAKFERGK